MTRSADSDRREDIATSSVPTPATRSSHGRWGKRAGNVQRRKDKGVPGNQEPYVKHTAASEAVPGTGEFSGGW